MYQDESLKKIAQKTFIITLYYFIPIQVKESYKAMVFSWLVLGLTSLATLAHTYVSQYVYIDVLNNEVFDDRRLVKRKRRNIMLNYPNFDYCIA